MPDSRPPRPAQPRRKGGPGKSGSRRPPRGGPPKGRDGGRRPTGNAARSSRPPRTGKPGKPGKPGTPGKPGKPEGRGKPRGAAEAVGRGGTLPRWVRDEMIRVTPQPKRSDALDALEQAAAAFAAGHYKRALDAAETAKSLASRDATTRELLGLSAYRLGRWDQARRELRTYRRISGDTSHVPVEMDASRALDEAADVEKAWELLEELGGAPATLKEGRVVYGSYLLDSGRPRDAWEVTNPGSLRQQPFEEDLRLWYVAARAAARLNDAATARRLLDAITSEAPGFPGLDELERVVAAASR